MKNKFEKIKELRYPQNKWVFYIKCVSALIFAWSCFFWGGVSIIYYFTYGKAQSYLAEGLLFGEIAIAVGIIMMFLRLHILQLPFIAIGGAIYLKYAGELIDMAKKKHQIFKPSFEVRYLPVIVIILVSVVFAMLQVWRLISIRTAEKEEYNNRPTGSILD